MKCKDCNAYSIHLQFEEVLSDSVSGKEKLRSLVDPALGDDYPLECMWKVGALISLAHLVA